MQKPFYALVLFLGIFLGCGETSGNKQQGAEPTASPESVQTFLPATSKQAQHGLELPYSYGNENIIEHMGYTLSYNERHRIPNWVAWELLSSELYGDFDRAEKFTPDPAWKGRQAYDSDYSGSGYDRGHMAPSGDMKWSSQTMRECFYLTNVCPQHHNLNSGVWNDLEKQTRKEAKYYGTIWICCGPVIDRGKGTIGRNKVLIPDGFFKALLARRKDGSYTSIGFYFPNEAGDLGLGRYAMSIDELEKLTGMDFFVNLDYAVQEKIEKTYDLWDWRIKK